MSPPDGDHTSPDLRSSADSSAIRARFPNTMNVWPVGEDGRCKCALHPNCKRPGKHADERAPANAAYAVLAGPGGVLIVDLDVKGNGDGFEQVKSWHLPDTFTVATPSGGAHAHLKHPGGTLANKKLDTAIDVRANARNASGYAYVIGPGSPGFVKTADPCVVMPASPYRIVDDLPFADAPELLVHYLGIGEEKESADAVEPIDEAHAAWTICCKLAEADCKNLEPSRADGEASTRLLALVRRLVRRFQLPDDKALELVNEHWNPRCTAADGETPYPWEYEDLHRAFRNSRARGPGKGMADELAIYARLTGRSRVEASVDLIANLKDRTEKTAEPRPMPNGSDTGNAELFARIHGADVRYVAAWDKWLAWDGQRWNVDDLGAVQAMTKAVIQARWAEVVAAPSEDARKPLVAWAKKTESRQGRENMVALARAEQGIAISHNALDAAPWLFNVANGTLDLRTGELRAHDRADGITKLSPIAFDSAATCPTWDRFLSRVLGGSASLESFLQRAVGYSLTGDVGEHVLFFLYGSGRNGKSTFTKVVQEMLGDLGIQAPPDLLLAQKNPKHETEIADLHGARFALCQEIEQGAAWAEARLKALTGGDKITARRMREDYWRFEPTHKLWVCGNHKPRVRGADEGIWSRIKLVPFTVTIPKEERDTGLLEKLRAELPGILAWAVRGCLAWQRDGLGVPKEIDEAVDNYRLDEDHVAAFLEEKCHVGPGLTVGKTELFSAYRIWAVATGEKIGEPSDLRERLLKDFTEAKTGKLGRHWKGLALRTLNMGAVVGPS